METFLNFLKTAIQYAFCGVDLDRDEQELRINATNWSDIPNTKFCNILMKAIEPLNDKIFLNFERCDDVSTSNVNEDLNNVTHQILELFINLISRNTRTKIPNGTDDRPLVPRISRIDIVCNYTHRQRVINRSRLSDEIWEIPFNDD